MNYTHSVLKAFSTSSEPAKNSQNYNKCRECGQDHSFRPDFEDVKTSIEIIPLLFEKLKQSEQSPEDYLANDTGEDDFARGQPVAKRKIKHEVAIY